MGSMKSRSLRGVFVGILSALTLWSARAALDPARQTNNLIVVNYDPILRGHGGTNLQRFMRWNNPRPMTTNLIRHLRESSRGYANFKLVDWIDVDAFPVKRDGFRYTEQSFLEMWKDKKRAHKPDSVSYAAIFKELNLVERVLGPNRAAIFVNLIPVSGATLAMFFLGERLYAYHLLGAALVFMGIVLAARHRA
jgi:hypothetical protein